MQDSNIALLPGRGLIGQKKFQDAIKNWGKLPPGKRAQLMQDLTRDMPPRHRELIERYLKELARSQQANP